jgi:broad specificity phosphatase PhoE
MTTFYFVRHGTSQANLDDEISRPDAPLTKQGEAEARKVGRSLKKVGITTIVCSPYDRARRTAEIIAKELKIKDIEIIDDLRERGLGQLEGRKHDRKHSEYYKIDGEADVEPRGVLIARCEAALAKIKKLSESGTVLAVGHTMAGFYLQQVAAGKRLFSEFDEPRDLPHGAYKKITVVDAPMRTGSRQLVLAFLAFMTGIACLIIGIWLLVTRPAPQPAKTSPDIPLTPEDYKDDPLLKGAVEKQLQQAQPKQTDPTGETLQPARH